MSRVFVLGSMNADSFLHVKNFVRPGETIMASSASSEVGGKGLNQAVASARMGVGTVMVGAVGSDQVGANLLESLEVEENLDLSRVARIDNESTGQAMIQLSESGENAIIVLAGANAANSPEGLEGRLAGLTAGDVLVCQLEIPKETVRAGFALAKANGATTILNAAPPTSDRSVLENVDILIVNETEASSLLAADEASPADGAGEDMTTITTLGEQGALVHVPGQEPVQIPALQIDLVDSTGAGDAFVGGLASALARGEEITRATAFGTALATSACGAIGAQGYSQRRADIESMVDNIENNTGN